MAFWNGLVQLQDALVSTRKLNLTALPGSINAADVVIYNSAGAIVDTFPISGTVAVTQSTSPWVVSGTIAATQSGTWNIVTVTTLTSITNPVAVTQSTSPWVVSGTVSATQSGTWILGANSGIDIGDVTINNATIAVTQSGTWTVDTELPAATLIADNEALPTTSRIGAVMMGLDSAGTANNVDVARLAKAHDLDSGAGTEYGTGISIRVEASGGSIPQTYGAGAVAAGTQRVTHASDDPAVTALQLIDNAVSGAGFNITQMNGVNVTMGNGVAGTGVQRVAVASDNTAFEVKTPHVAGKALVPYAARITTNVTTTPTAATAWVSSIVITTEVAGTTSTIEIKNKEATPKVLIPNSIVTTVAGVQIYNFEEPQVMTSGIDIVTAGAVAATVDVFISYWQ